MAGSVAQEVEHHKSEALSSNSSTTKKTQKRIRKLLMHLFEKLFNFLIFFETQFSFLQNKLIIVPNSHCREMQCLTENKC
jgi:hypothetical protein